MNKLVKSVAFIPFSTLIFLANCSHEGSSSQGFTCSLPSSEDLYEAFNNRDYIEIGALLDSVWICSVNISDSCRYIDDLIAFNEDIGNFTEALKYTRFQFHHCPVPNSEFWFPYSLMRIHMNSGQMDSSLYYCNEAILNHKGYKEINFMDLIYLKIRLLGNNYQYIEACELLRRYGLNASEFSFKSDSVRNFIINKCQGK